MNIDRIMAWIIVNRKERDTINLLNTKLKIFRRYSESFIVTEKYEFIEIFTVLSTLEC